MDNATVHPRKRFLINVASSHDRAAWDIAAAQRFGQRDDVRLQIPMLETEHFSRAPESGLHLVGNEQRPVLATKFLRPHKKIGPGRLAAFALHRLDYERGHVARS